MGLLDKAKKAKIEEEKKPDEKDRDEKVKNIEEIKLEEEKQVEVEEEKEGVDEEGEEIEFAEEVDEEEEEIESEADFKNRLKTMNRKERKKAEIERKKAARERKKLSKEIARERKRKESGKPLSKKERLKKRKIEEANKLEKKKELKQQLKDSHKRKIEELKERRLKAKDKALEKEIEELERKAEEGELEIAEVKSEVLPEGVHLAGWFQRFIAGCVDFIITTVIPFLAIIMTSSDSGPLLLGAILSFIVIPISYYFVLEGINGQTIGKMILRIRTTDISGRKVDNSKLKNSILGKGFIPILFLPLDLLFGFLKSRNLKQRFTQYKSDIIVVEDNDTVKELAKEGLPEKPKKEKNTKVEEELGEDVEDMKTVIETLVNIKGISRIVAENIYNAGFTSIHSLKKAKVIDFKGIKKVGPATAKKIVEGMKEK